MKAPRTERRISLLAALLGVSMFSACALRANFSEESAWDDSGGSAASEGAGGATSGGSSGSGGEMDASIIVEPDGEGAPPPNPYAGLCGEGACVIGDDTGCEDNGEPQSCQLVAAMDTAVAQCAKAGTTEAGIVCKTSEDCLPGLGCAMTSPAGGVCRPYCCDDLDLCPANTVCTPQPITNDKLNATPVSIPVCVPTQNCVPLTPGMCQPGFTCTIVKSDGTTDCVPVGEGKAGEPCPCADGYVCSKLTNECKKLCEIGKDEAFCGATATCQAGIAGYPGNIGTCVGGSIP